jgi:hypothetical protein
MPSNITKGKWLDFWTWLKYSNRTASKQAGMAIFDSPAAPFLVVQIAGHRLAAGLNVQLLVNPAQIGTNGGNADAQLIGNLLVGKPLGQAVKNRLLPRRQ